MSDDHRDFETDVVVAGAGGAGLFAALESAEAGAKTVVFEKQARLWESSTAIAVGRVSFPCTDIQRNNGVEDSPELMARDILETGRHLNDPALVRTYVDNALDTYERMVAMGVVWSKTVTAMAGMSVPRGHLTDMIDLVRLLKREAEAHRCCSRRRSPASSPTPRARSPGSRYASAAAACRACAPGGA
jgi:fumarate reductase flavoprotein subunit